MDVSKSLLEKIHTPTLYILGGKTDIAYANGMDGFARIKEVPVFLRLWPVQGLCMGGGEEEHRVSEATVTAPVRVPPCVSRVTIEARPYPR